MNYKDIFTGGEPNMNLDDLLRDVQSLRLAFHDIAKGIGRDTYSYIISGCTVSLIDGGTKTQVTAGYIFLDGEVLQVDKHTVEWPYTYVTTYYQKETSYETGGDKLFLDGVLRQTWRKDRGVMTATVTNLSINGNRVVNVVVPDATTTTKGKVELGTASQHNALSSTTVACVPGYLPTASDTQKGLTELGTAAEHNALSSTTVACVPGYLPIASTTQRGLSELSTDAETQAGASTTVVVTPASLLSGIKNGVAFSSTSLNRGAVELATNAETQAGTDSERAVTPASLASKDGGLITTVIEISSWNMDSTSIIYVAHSLTYSKVRSIEVLIRNDDDTERLNLLDSNATGVGGGSARLESSNIELHRSIGGLFDNTSYDSTGYVRGWIIIKSIP